MHSLTLSRISKTYAGVPALSDVSLTLRGGRVHALMGENGAGKSTLIKLLAGVVPADHMQVARDGVNIPLTHAQDAHDAGFRFIHQELNIVPQISVAENILLGRRYPRRFGLAIDWRALRRQAQAALEFLGAEHIPVGAPAGSLSGGDKMLIKIAAAFAAGDEAQADLFVFDEPTAALTGEESAKLFAVIDQLKNRGAAILYVSHRIDEVLQICDDVTVLRDGRLVSSGPTRDTSKTGIIQAMTGRKVRDAYPPRDHPVGQDIVASARAVTTPRLTGLDFDLLAGEILGVTGLSDAGQGEFLRLFLGQEQCLRGSLTYQDSPPPNSPSDAWGRGIAYIPRERRAEALMLDLPIRANIVLPHLNSFGWRASKSAETEAARGMCDKVRLKYDSPEQAVGQLSGGNQQKVVFARALFGAPKLLLLEEPTRGVDVGAKYDIYQLVREQSARGCAVILTSTDLPEILGMCDRILVLQDGHQSALLDRGTLTSAGLLRHFYPDEAA